MPASQPGLARTPNAGELAWDPRGRDNLDHHQMDPWAGKKRHCLLDTRSDHGHTTAGFEESGFFTRSDGP
jgi:hypothetical protein